jgi:hypothetical protein
LKRQNGNSTVSRFNKLSFHDDNLLSVTVHPPRTRRNQARIDFRLRDYSTEREKFLSFLSCANIRYTMDFDVLADNSFAQTDASIAKNNVDQMKKTVRSQMAHWHTQYMPPQPKDMPVRKKLSAIRNYTLFKLTFFGGTAEILAKNFELRLESEN